MAETWRVSKLDVELKFEHGVPVISAAGECDLVTCRRLKEMAEQVVSSGCKNLIFDLRGMTYIDSSGFRVLLDAKRLADANGGDIALVSLTTPVERLFELLHLQDLLITADSVEDALAKLAPS